MFSKKKIQRKITNTVKIIVFVKLLVKGLYYKLNIIFEVGERGANMSYVLDKIIE